MKIKAKRACGKKAASAAFPSVANLVRQAVLLHQAKDMVKAEETYRKAMALNPRSVDTLTGLGLLMMDGRRYVEAQELFDRALTFVRPGNGRDGIKSGTDPRQNAIHLLAELVEAGPAWSNGQLYLGIAYHDLGEYEKAQPHLDKALELDPGMEGPVKALTAKSLWKKGKWTEALQAADRALEINPANYFALVIRSGCYKELGLPDETADSLRRAIAIRPEPDLHNSLVFVMNFQAGTTPEAVYEEASRWNSIHAAPLSAKIRPHNNVPDPDRRIKIAYVSPDLYQHAIMKFLPPVLEHQDASRFEVYVYSVGGHADNRTKQLEQKQANFVAFQGLGSELAERVRGDGIDILIDLAGQTMLWKAFQVFAYKPAPVQVSWMGVAFTTGMTAMDYFVGDPNMPCPGTEHLFSETVYRVSPVSYTYRPVADVPLSPPPFLNRGHITFGCFNKPQKVTREVVQLWSRILHAVPGSRLLLKYPGVELGIVRKRFQNWFAEHGISDQRLRFAGGSPPVQYLNDYGEVDIALDPFPHNGGTTTLDGLWMGIPCVTLAGRLPVQRVGTSILRGIGADDWVAETPEQYVQTTLELVGALPNSPDLRHDIRRALERSPIMDEAGMVRRMEAAFRDMWRTWCLQQTRSPAAAVATSGGDPC